MSEISAFKLIPTVEGPHDVKVVIAARNPGEAGSLWPVLPYVARDPNFDTTIIAADCARDSLVEVSDIGLSPFSEPGELVIDSLAKTNSVMTTMTGVSTKTDMHTSVARAFPDARRLFVEDYYGSLDLHLERCFSQGLPTPDHIVTLDEFAKQEIIKKYGRTIVNIASIVEVTGQPVFDYLVDKDGTAQLRNEGRRALGLSDDDTLIACFSSVDTLELVDGFAEELAKGKTRNVSVVFNPHPRDLTSPSDYRDVFKHRGIQLHNTENWTYQQLLAASDIATILPHSTLSLHAIKLGKPTLHIANEKDGIAAEQVPVRRGVSPLVLPSEFWDVSHSLLDVSSRERTELLEAMKELYPVKGGNAARVAASLGEMVSSSLVETSPIAS